MHGSRETLNVTAPGLKVDISLPITTNVALSLVAANVKGSVFLSKGFEARGLVTLDFAKIGGNLNCSGSRFQNPLIGSNPQSGTAFSGRTAKIDGGVFFRSFNRDQGRCVITGAILMDRAQIGGAFECDGSKFDNPASMDSALGGVALNLESAIIAGPLLLRNQFHALGLVHLYNADIGGDFQCDGSFENPAVKNSIGSGMALNAAAIKVGGGLVLRGIGGTGLTFAAKGMVSMFRARIQRNLECDGGRFENAADKNIPGSGSALIANGIDVAGDVYLRKSFQADGLVSLYSALIGGNLDCDGGHFTNPAKERESPGGVALHGALARISGNVYCRSSFQGKGTFVARGRVLLTGSQIDGKLRL
jgi:hypothetical protein